MFALFFFFFVLFFFALSFLPRTFERKKRRCYFVEFGICRAFLQSVIASLVTPIVSRAVRVEAEKK